MCGIAGELRFDRRPADLAAVERITHHLAPRGPDAHGFHSQGPIALGHRRLKIMDLAEASGQPMIDSDLGMSMVFNGAIYNYPELRAELEALGYRFFSGGDTEVLLKGYHAWGENLLPKLNGMFAFAVWERDKQSLFIARDRLGVKPLYLSRTGERLRFASSLPALLQGGDIAKTLDAVALNHYLNFHAVVPAPRTILAGVEKLPPATWMRVDADGKIEQKTWWTLQFGPQGDEAGYGLEEWRDQVLHTMREAVAIRQRAAVDVGVLLSGGVDSSMLVGLLREAGVENLLTFSIGFQDAGGERGDEFQYSDLIAQRFATRHHQLRIGEHEILDQLPNAFRAMSEPMVSHDCIAFYLLSREVAKHCKVVQSGQGADELFAGYHWYPQVDGADDAFAAYRAAFFDREHDEYAACVQPAWLTGDMAGDFVREHFAMPGASAAVDKALRLDSTVMLVDDPVKRVDNMTMAWGLEARTPFLDYRVAELSARIPAQFKLPDGGKYVLKEAARKVIPSEVIDRPKGYFPVPGLKHLEGATLGWVRDLLLDPSQDRGLFNPTMLDQLLTNPQSQLTPLRGSKLWQLAALNLWLSEQGL
ncbi:N-acetylglutaminylglutamine amidotransferase [Pseudomonas sp. MDMC216]|jgi:asparagine synthase (glutamine-hydrolysing)|uniref:asparagine synthase (glutamine-hydrolyzing) n=1 Tax=Ectopseudomonas chengduensis TaxID=489632 RepID=A0A1G6NBK4_9GAMM|nr:MULTISPECIES: N-acetylglutaminylglutamine amidotransferase [Pseudomonas]KQO31274.1 asparagine synthase [Pseudomonas sp. Leaf83]MBP3061639.1 N-acetylglutaminylglutamine amidotransferase [Pseudomonas chengduensis]MDH0960288.1 N-acetylglutaminylglutamine amidotransferase [Pseudomonas chengduensis]MDI5991630.1 N-acetylglutaminylglutamine amidotransferase [Pseudomonas sp. MDMC216]MDI6009855.1 N-acetylglutaminylglutamine amidotransferase [Pseudomonas sp. MDMC17]